VHEEPQGRALRPQTYGLFRAAIDATPNRVGVRGQLPYLACPVNSSSRHPWHTPGRREHHGTGSGLVESLPCPRSFLCWALASSGDCVDGPRVPLVWWHSLFGPGPGLPFGYHLQKRALHGRPPIRPICFSFPVAGAGLCGLPGVGPGGPGPRGGGGAAGGGEFADGAVRGAGERGAQRGLELAIQETNAGGRGAGLTIELATRDDEGKADRAVAAAGYGGARSSAAPATPPRRPAGPVPGRVPALARPAC